MSSDAQEDLALRVDNRFHDDELEDGTDDGSEALDSKGGTRRKLGVLTEFEITSETESLSARVVSVKSEVKVGLRVTGNEGSSEHLSELLNIGFLWREKGISARTKESSSGKRETHESSDGVDNANEGEHKEGEDQSDDESPPRKLRSTGV